MCARDADRRRCAAPATRPRPAARRASSGRRRCLRLERGFATITRLMSAPGFSRGRTVAPRQLRRRHPGLGPRAVLSVESPRLPFFDGSTHKASPSANWFNRARQSAIMHRLPSASCASLSSGSGAPDRRRDGPRAPRAVRAPAMRRSGKAALDLCNNRLSRGRDRALGDRPARRASANRSSNFASPACAPSRSIPASRGPLAGRSRHYIRSIIALPNPEQLTCVEPGIRRAKS